MHTIRQERVYGNKYLPTCHAPIPANAPGGFCPACLLRDAEEPPAYGHSAPPLEEIAAAFPQLEVLGLIGQGGMGFVYKVRQPSLDRIIALKILSPELGRDPAFAERFSREARTLGKLHHPNIVTIFEHGESGGFFYLTMEYVDGVNLRQAMRAGRFSPEQALAIVPGICDALQTAHEQGIWHRDIKPENILLDRDGKVKIADFGIARIVGDPQRDFTLTRTGNALGSVSYMAPEQHEKPHEVDHRADIYSLGVVIYEMLTGELPLGRFPAPSQLAAVDARIDEIVFKTLEKERELRQQSATEVKTDVHRMMTSSAATVAAPAAIAIQSSGTRTGAIGFWMMMAAVVLPFVLMAISRRAVEPGVFLSVFMLVISFVLGVLGWKETLGKMAVIGSALVLLAYGVILLANVRQVESVAARESTQPQPDSSKASAQPQPLPEYDFSTPEGTAASMINAAKRNDLEGFKRGISTALLEMTSREDASLAEPINDWKPLLFLAEVSLNGDRAVVRLKNPLKNAETDIPMIREGGEWKITLSDRDVVDQSPRATMEAILRAAREKDTQSFRMGLSQSLLALIDEHDQLDKTIEQLAAFRLVGHRLIHPSNAEVTLESDGEPMKATFRMIMEDGLWKLTEKVVNHD